MTAGEKAAAESVPTAETADPESTAQESATEPTDEAIVSDPEVQQEREVVDPKDAQIQALRAEIEQSKQTLDQNTARLKAVSKAYNDIQAEIKAVKERMEHRAKLDSELQAFDQVRAFFDPVMNLKRALSVQGDPEVLRQGIDMVHQQFLDALRKLGLAEVPGIGASFDPTIHEALGVQPVTDRALDGRVLAVHTAGFTVKGRVLQAAQVVIGKYEAAPEA